MSSLGTRDVEARIIVTAVILLAIIAAATAIAPVAARVMS